MVSIVISPPRIRTAKRLESGRNRKLTTSGAVVVDAPNGFVVNMVKSVGGLT